MRLARIGSKKRPYYRIVVMFCQGARRVWLYRCSCREYSGGHANRTSVRVWADRIPESARRKRDVNLAAGAVIHIDSDG